MQKFTKLLFGAVFLLGFTAKADNYWQQINEGQAPKNLMVLHPEKYVVYKLDEAAVKLQLWNASTDPVEGVVITIPQPDGTLRDFKAWQTPMMPQDLAAKYPDIKSFTAEAIDDSRVTAKLDFTLYGFHAMVFDGDNTFLVDPYDNYNDGLYVVRYKKHEARAINDRMQCLLHTDNDDLPGGELFNVQKDLPKLGAKVINGYELRTYRLALSANSPYCKAATGLVTPTIAQCFSKMTTTINRVNGVYERELSATMVFAANEDKLIWPTATGSTNGPDPFVSINSNPGSCISQNQTECDTRIGSGNYDCGHVFTTGAGGLSLLGVVCASGNKAKSVTGSLTPFNDGFDIDYVAHEMGHAFGGDHTFNNNVDGSCAGNAVVAQAYEPGSGSTIMAYAGICGPDNVQPNSNPYFHTASLLQIRDYIVNGTGDNCPVKTATGNKLVAYTPFAATHSIPYLTPFELTGPNLTDSMADSTKLYCWEEWDLGDFGQRFSSVTTTGPNFRSFNPAKAQVRVFPKISMVLNGVLSDAGTNNNQGEKAPTVARTLKFRCTLRNIRNNKGCFTFPDDQVTLNAINTGAGFKVTSQSSVGTIYPGGSTQTITWNVVGSNAAPINAANVDIYMSLNGTAWPYFIGTFPNTGSANVTVPNPATSSTTCRFKVKGSGNVFFNVNSANFTVTNNPSAPVTPASPTGAELLTAAAQDIKLYPNPASNTLYVATGAPMKAAVYNAIGQQVWEGSTAGETEIPVAHWARGIYIIVLSGDNKERTVKRFVVE
jgi:hypothetical protein